MYGVQVEIPMPDVAIKYYHPLSLRRVTIQGSRLWYGLLSLLKKNYVVVPERAQEAVHSLSTRQAYP